MASDTETDRMLARRGRRAALIMALTVLGWLGAQFLGGRLDWDVRLAFVFDALAMAGLLAALWVTFQIYRQRRK